MAHGKETPRQKMIGMMYLVLTALLALNVSKDVLDAFVLVDRGLTETTENFSKKNNSLYSDFQAANELNPTKVGDWKARADRVQAMSDSLYHFIQEAKKEIIVTSEGPETPAIQDDEIDLALVTAKDNADVPAEIMIQKKRGEELKKQIDYYRESLLSMIENKEDYAPVVSSVESTLDTNPPEKSSHSKGEKLSWESEHFEHLPLASVITILSKMQSDVRNTEAEMLGYLLSQIDAGSFKFNKIEAVVLESSDYVFKGQEYKAQVFLAAYDSTKLPTVTLNDGSKLDVKDGKGIFTSTTSATGLKKWGGTIVIEGDDGNTIVRKFSEEYQVAEASAVVSPTKMNVFYRGVANPVAISVSGVPKENIQADITKGKISRTSNGEWQVSPAAGPEDEVISVRVYATVDNNRRFMGSMDFRVKDVPPPVAKIAGRSQGAITMPQLTSARGVDAVLENFLFDLDFTVTEFMVSAVLSGGFSKSEKSDNAKFTRPQIEIISQLSAGKTLTVTDIKAIGPDGKVRALNSIVLKII